MNIPGSNLLNMALRVIAPASFIYYACASRALQPNGQWLANYLAPVQLQGSAQPVPRNLYAQNGLQFDKLYYHFFVPQSIVDVARDVSGDLMVFNGQTYQCQSITPWFAVDGWVEILAVAIPTVTLVTALTYPTAGGYVTDDVLTFTATYNNPVTVTGTPFITLAAIAGLVGGNALYTGGTGTAVLTFAYTVVSGDTAAGLTVSSPISGTIMNGLIPANSSFIPPDLSGVILN